VLDSDGEVEAVELVHCTSVFDTNGCFDPAFDTSVRRTVEADQIILAVGQRADLSFIDREFALNIDRGLITIDGETQQTSIPGIFAGGDVTSGPATVIQSVVAGKRAAEAINHYLLKGEAAPARRSSHQNDDALLAVNPLALKKTSRAVMTELPVSERSLTAEDVLGLTRDEIGAEADRCFNCGCVAVNASDIAPALIALNAKIRTTTRELGAEEFFSAQPMTTTVLESNELVREIEIPEQGPDDRSAFLKFRTRQSIDFPIVNVAVALKMSSKTIRSARVVLGAVAPIPLRATSAEDFLAGKDFGMEVAEKAAEIAVEGVHRLDRNEFKIDVTKALVKRAIMSAGGSPG
jgi:CO/xanthine dehydrogenase FAD-binding subunit